MRVAVAGGTGQVGARVVRRLEEDGHQVVVLSRGRGVDLVRGTGIDEALAGPRGGVDSIVDATSTSSQKAAECVSFFGGVAAHLQAAGGRAGVGRVVTLSVVGIDQMPGRGHYAGKLAQEAATSAGAVPWTVLRATQFHTFGGSLIEWVGKGPFLPCPQAPVQTVDLDVVAAHLARLATTSDDVAGTTVDLAGPQRLMLRDVVRRTARARGRRGVVVPVRLPGTSERAARDGAMLPPEGSLVEGRSFDQWIEAGAPA